jgi:hypothetical protein
MILTMICTTIICVSMFWQPSMGKGLVGKINDERQMQKDLADVHWLRRLRIDIPEIPENSSGALEDASGLRIGYREYEGIYLSAIQENGSGYYKLIAFTPLELASSSEYAKECRKIAGSAEMIEKYVLDGLGKKIC